MQEQNDSSRTQQQVLAMLTWYRAMGVGDVVGETTVDWLARGDVPPLGPPRRSSPASGPMAGAPTGSAAGPATGHDRTSHASSNVQPVGAGDGARTAPPLERREPQTARPAVAVKPDAAMGDALAAANAANDLAALRTALEQFEGCALKATAKNTCFFRGAEQARVMVVGEAPGRDEDRSGMPFVGRAGQLLDKMLAAIGLDDATTHITNVVYWRPPGNRTPTPHEVLVCRPFLERQIQLVRPDIIVTVGGPAAKAILDTQQGIMRTRGKWGEFSAGQDQAVRVMPTLHPAYLLRTPAAKRLAWRDLLAVRAELAG